MVYDSEDEIKRIEPNIAILNQININPGGIIVTAKAKSEDIDFVSRFFTPQAAVFEDPVTGSAHCTLIPFWALSLLSNSLMYSEGTSSSFFPYIIKPEDGHGERKEKS